MNRPDLVFNGECRFVLLMLAVLLTAGCGTDTVDQARLPVDASPSISLDIDATPRPVEPILPGTVIADVAPEPWTHLILKSRTRVGPDSVDEVSEQTARLAGMLFTAFVAEVAADDAGGFRLARIGVGVGLEVDGADMVLSSDKQAELGANLGFLDRQVLGGGEDQVEKMRIVARSATMAVLDTSSVYLHQQEHRAAVLRYVFLVDKATGRLDTVVWLLLVDEDGNYSQPVGPMQWLPPDMVEECLLHVDPDEFVLGVPTVKAFAAIEVPQGRQTSEFPPDLLDVASARQFSREEARRLQQGLKELAPQP